MSVNCVVKELVPRETVERLKNLTVSLRNATERHCGIYLIPKSGCIVDKVLLDELDALINRAVVRIRAEED
uniref:Uncharacterized protein n=1 Tax=viral metagenome TaxID=1070528 RepID=A0A6H1ZST4_9ZZZZ